jgi:hypothetical protein
MITIVSLALAFIAVTAFLTILGVHSHGEKILLARKVGPQKKLDSVGLYISSKGSAQCWDGQGVSIHL